jgi:Glycosyl transferases group 1
VIEFPRLERYHRPPPRGAFHPQLWFDFPEPERTLLRDAVLTADAVVIGSLRSGIRTIVDEVLGLAGRPPVVYIDGEDLFYVLGVLPHVDVYFKRELVLPGGASRLRELARRVRRRMRQRKEVRDRLADPVGVARAGNARLRPLPFGWVGPLPEPQPKEFDVTFLNRPTSPQRAVVRAQLERLAADGVRVRLLAEGESLDWWSYMDILARSRIGVSVRGLGYDTFRYWEIPAAQALLLAETPRIVIPGNFVDGREAVFAPVDRLVERIPGLLADGTEAIARAGHERLLEAHTSVQRGQTVLDAIASLA